MKSNLFILFLSVFLFLSTSQTMDANTKNQTSFQQKKKSTKKKKATKKVGCYYNGNKLYVGKRGGCYYYSGDNKVYVDRSYCNGCN